MSLSKAITRLFSNRPRMILANTVKRHSASRHRLILEHLEDRLLLTSYTYVDLPPPPGGNGPSSFAYAVTKLQTDGTVMVIGVQQPRNSQITTQGVYWVYNPQKQMFTIQGTLPILPRGALDQALAVNNSEVIVGESNIMNTTAIHATEWQPSGSPPSYPTATDLGALMQPPQGSQAQGINNNNSVVGWTNVGTPQQFTSDGFLMKSGGSMQDLGSLAGAGSQAQGINDSGTIVGDSSAGGSNPTHAVYWDSSTLTIHDMGSLIGSSGSSDAFAINASGLIVGQSSWNGAGQHAFSFTNGTFTDLSPGVTSGAQALAVNGSGAIVGNEGHPYLWSGGTATDLTTVATPPPGFTMSNADGINDSGYIVGWSHNPNSHGGQAYDHGFLLIPNGSGPRAPSSPTAPTSLGHTPAPQVSLGAPNTAAFSPNGITSMLAGNNGLTSSSVVSSGASGKASIWESPALTFYLSGIAPFAASSAAEVAPPLVAHLQGSGLPTDIGQLTSIGTELI